MKKLIVIMLSCLMAMSFFGCTDNPEIGTDPTAKASDYESDAEFITIADLPPNPMSQTAIEVYKALGFNTMILTEDSASFTKNGVITDEYKRAIQNIGDSGLEVWIRNMYNDADYFQNDEPEKERSNYGSPYKMEARNITTELSEFSQITGYYMSDEPFMTSDLSVKQYGKQYASMDQYQKLIDWKNAYAPDAFWHMNMVPSQSYDHFPSDKTYRDFIQYYVDNIVSKVAAGCGRSVCLDNYPFSEQAPDEVAQSFLVDLMTAAVVTRDYNETAETGKEATFGICLQTFKNTHSTAGLRYPETAAEITFQMYTGMALGARLFEYFCYRSLSGMGLYGLIDESGQPTAEYEIVKTANEQAFPFSKVVCNFDWYNLIASSAENITNVENSASFNGVEKLSEEETGVLTSVSSKYDAIVGCFKKGETDGYMAVNYSTPKKGLTNTIKMNFEGCTQAIVWTESGSKVVKLLNGECRLNLSAGGAAFIVPVK